MNETKQRRVPKSPVRKPNFDAWSTGKSALRVIPLIPVFLVVGVVAQVLEALYYVAIAVFYVVTSPYWITRTLYRALRPANTPERVTQREDARAAVRVFFLALAWIVGILVVFAAILVGLVELLDN